ncbi:hypothetical protein F4V43_02465 [Paenibacillus spiritus]|uniref:RNA-dependent RNA polymerase n=1 Tax=Paenibacillus spiritus TaxID=2496557 RepID=A0A5J5GH88_9BACL|nr:hypothetical protein [Paenibacillus spiritus]KAA9007370.1 hypothetical protein F4V43_02465 [Paenibacillus spiritus]
MSKILMYDVLKVRIQEIIKEEFNLKLNKDEELPFLIKQQDTPLFRQLCEIRGYDTKRIRELIFVEAKHNKKRVDDLKRIIRDGFIYNDTHYVRFGKSSSQAKDGITVFINKEFYKEMMERSQLGVNIDKCVISKYESYRCLIFSSCQFVKEDLPYIVLVDEYKTVLKNKYVRYAAEKDIEYYDKNARATKVLKNQKVIEEGYHDIEQSPFDGFGVHTKEVGEKFAKHITDKYIPIGFQIRLPFLKGMTVQAPIKEYYADKGITKIKDIFGKWHNVADIDCIWNTSMWKGYGFFKDKFGENAWVEYIKRVNKYRYKLGISKHSHNTDYVSPRSRMNFQYLQCLDLLNPKYVQQFKEKDNKYNILDSNNWGKIIKVAVYSTDFIEKIIKGDLLYTLKFLGIRDSSIDSVNSNYIEAILANTEMLKDPSIKNMLKRKVDKAITQMKYGKIYVDGFYHTVVGDIIGYLEYCAGIEVKGCIREGEFYVKTLPHGECLSLRSPLVDPSEVNRVRLTENDMTKKYLSYFLDQDMCMINMYDLTLQQQGGMDTDGDAVMLCRDEILVNSRINVPIVVDIEDKKSSSPVEYTIDNIIKYECNSRDSRIGEITNIATSILNQYTEDATWKKINADNVSLLRLYQGKEIDYVKTGFRWVISKNLRKYLKRLPHFILYNYPKKLSVYNKIKRINQQNRHDDRIPYNSFKSPSPLNELCDYICQWERHNIIWDRKVNNNIELMIDHSYDLSNKHILKNIKRLYDEFKVEFQVYLDNGDTDGNEFDMLCDKYREKFSEIRLDNNLLANYGIKVAYRSLSEDKLLCWTLFGDNIVKNIRKNTPNKTTFKIFESDITDEDSKEFLGRYYKLIKE